MRELKFRAWDDSDKEKGAYMLGPYDLTDSIFDYVGIRSLKLMQFTGLQDKNVSDVYEGDILEFKNDLGRQNLHKVFRVDGGLVINSHSDDICKDSIVFYEACADMQTSQWIRQCEIIGNIHQNPELIKNQ